MNEQVKVEIKNTPEYKELEKRIRKIEEDILKLYLYVGIVLMLLFVLAIFLSL